jgi:hypothetical protein
MVHTCLAATDTLSKQHEIEAAVVDAHSLPLDSQQHWRRPALGPPSSSSRANYVGVLGSELAEAAASAGDEAL